MVWSPSNIMRSCVLIGFLLRTAHCKGQDGNRHCFALRWSKVAEGKQITLPLMVYAVGLNLGGFL